MKQKREFSNPVIVKDFTFNNTLHRMAVVREASFERGIIDFTGNFDCLLIIENEGTRFCRLTLEHGGKPSFVNQGLGEQILAEYKQAVNSTQVEKRAENDVSYSDELNKTFPYHFTIKEFTLDAVGYTAVVTPELFYEEDSLDSTGSYECIVNSISEGLSHFTLVPTVDDNWISEDGEECDGHVMVALNAIIKEIKGAEKFDIELVQNLIDIQDNNTY